MVQLYRHKPAAMQNLAKVRINPNLLSGGEVKRADLEFFIPQLCSFYLESQLDLALEQEILQILT